MLLTDIMQVEDFEVTGQLQLLSYQLLSAEYSQPLMAGSATA